MKHLLAVLAIGLAVVYGLGEYTRIMAPEENEEMTVIAAQDETISVLKVGILTNSADTMEDIRFRDIITTALPDNCTVHTTDANNDIETQMAMFRKMVSEGYSLILIDVIDLSTVDAYTEIAMHQNVPLIFTGERPSQEQLGAWEGLYYLGASSDDAYSALADAVTGIWLRARGMLDRNADGVLKYSVLSAESYTGAQNQKSFESRLIGSGITSELVTGSVTGVFSYDITEALDEIAAGESELLICSSSSDAYQAWQYYHDAAAFETVPQIEIALSAMDDGAQSLVDDGSVLVAAGYDGEGMGNLGARLCAAILSGGEMDEETLGTASDGHFFEYDNTVAVSERVGRYSQEVAAQGASSSSQAE